MSSPSEPHTVTFADVTQERHTEMLDWLLDNHVEYHCWVAPTNAYHNTFINPPLSAQSHMDCSFRFEDADQAMLFKLTWHS
jgi:hypothetical protein